MSQVIQQNLEQRANPECEIHPDGTEMSDHDNAAGENRRESDQKAIVGDAMELSETDEIHRSKSDVMENGEDLSNRESDSGLASTVLDKADPQPPSGTPTTCEDAKTDIPPGERVVSFDVSASPSTPSEYPASTAPSVAIPSSPSPTQPEPEAVMSSEAMPTPNHEATGEQVTPVRADRPVPATRPAATTISTPAAAVVPAIDSPDIFCLSNPSAGGVTSPSVPEPALQSLQTNNNTFNPSVTGDLLPSSGLTLHPVSGSAEDQYSTQLSGAYTFYGYCVLLIMFYLFYFLYL